MGAVWKFSFNLLSLTEAGHELLQLSLKFLSLVLRFRLGLLQSLHLTGQLLIIALQSLFVFLQICLYLVLTDRQCERARFFSWPVSTGDCSTFNHWTRKLIPNTSLLTADDWQCSSQDIRIEMAPYSNESCSLHLYGLLSWPAPAAQRSPPKQCRASVLSPGSETHGFSSRHRWPSLALPPLALVWSFMSKRHIIRWQI